MKGRRKTGGKRPVHAELMTRRPKAASARPAGPKPARPEPSDELLRALKAWFARGAGGEQASDEALSAAGRDGRWRLKQTLDRVFRHYARLTWLLERHGAPVGPDWLWAVAAVVLDGSGLEETARRLAVTTADISRIAGSLARMSKDGLDHPEMANPVRLELPDDVYLYLSDTYGANLESEAKALNIPALTTLRANSLKASREALVATLENAGLAVRPTVLAPLGLTVRGAADPAATEAFAAGQFDMQDEGSQLVALMADARPGQQVLDVCGGAGGKSLALAAAMGNRGHLVTADTSARRLARAKLRMKRAGVENAERVLLTGTDADPFLKKKAGWFDRVLVDAPCSGTGAWRRHPEAKWAVALDLERLTALQDAILNRAAPLVKRGGRLIYATCSLLTQENGARAEAFLKAHPNFRRIDAAEAWRAVSALPYPGRDPAVLQLTPFQHGTDGFFAAVFERAS